MKVIVRTPSRLHFGFIDLRGNLGRKYGSSGVALKTPRTVVEAEEKSKLQIEGLNKERTRYFVNLFTKKLKLNKKFSIRVREVIPPHVGLGSGTQLALAIGLSISKLFGLSLKIEEISELMERGKVSGVGIHAFKLGGFIIDGGRKVNETEKNIPPLIFRHDFPSEWKFMVCIPPISKGLSGKMEKEIMEKLKPSLTNQEISNVARTVLLRLIPALMEKNIVEFGEALTFIEKMTGKAFKIVQGGIFRNEKISRGINILLEGGAYGAGQSSWGPAFYGLFTDEEIEETKEKLAREIREKTGAKIFLAEAKNTGAEVIEV